MTTDEIAANIKLWFQSRLDNNPVDIGEIARGVNMETPQLRSAISKLMRDNILEWANARNLMPGTPHTYQWRI